MWKLSSWGATHGKGALLAKGIGTFKLLAEKEKKGGERSA